MTVKDMKVKHFIELLKNFNDKVVCDGMKCEECPLWEKLNHGTNICIELTKISNQLRKEKI